METFGLDGGGVASRRPSPSEGYDAENHLTSVTGTNLVAQFTYNADGQRVKSVVNGETIYFVGGYYEKKGSEITSPA